MIDLDRISSSSAIASVLGSLVTALRFTPGVSLPERISNAIAGSAGAVYATPALVEWLSIKSQAYENGLAFALGLFAMSLMAALTQAIKDTQWSQVLTEWLRKRAGG